VNVRLPDSIVAAALCLGIAMPEAVPFKTLDSGIQAGVERPRDVVARTADEWKKLCADYAHGRPCPQVDLAHSTVIGIFLGTRPSAGYAVEIVGIRRDGDSLVVTWRERVPGPDEMAAQMITTPYVVATIDRFAGSIRFVRAKKP
jgi:hypothetical protein